MKLRKDKIDAAAGPDFLLTGPGCCLGEILDNTNINKS